jgi:putative flippase GtrA
MLAITETKLGGQVLGAFVGFILGTSVSYVGNSLFVFRARLSSKGATRFWIVTLIGLGFNLTIAYWLERFGVRPLWTAIAIFATVPLLNYLGHRIWTFRDLTPETQHNV